jgi:hypothetical protein
MLIGGYLLYSKRKARETSTNSMTLFIGMAQGLVVSVVILAVVVVGSLVVTGKIPI